jgi:hypothetical protein
MFLGLEMAFLACSIPSVKEAFTTDLVMTEKEPTKHINAEMSLVYIINKDTKINKSHQFLRKEYCIKPRLQRKTENQILNTRAHSATNFNHQLIHYFSLIIVIEVPLRLRNQ